MANTRLSDLTAGSAVASTDKFYGVETDGVGGVVKTGAQLAEFSRDVLGSTLTGGTDISIVVDDALDTITINNTATSYTAEDAQDAVGAMVDSTLTYVDATPSLGVADNAIDNAKIDNTDTYSFASVGIGTTSPDFDLHIVGSQVRLEGDLPILTLKDTGDSGVGQRGYVSFRDSGNVQTAYMGLASSSNDSIYIWNGVSTGGILLGAGGGTALEIFGTGRTVKVHNRLTVNGDNDDLNELVVNGNHIFDGDLDYGITIRAFEPGLCMVDASTSSGQSLIRTLADGGIELWHDTGNNDGTIGSDANTTDNRSAAFGETEVSFYTNGTERMTIGSSGGVHHPSASGGDKGNNTINYGAVYDDNSLLSCYVFDQVLDETIIEEKWDEKVPDIITPATAWKQNFYPEVVTVRQHEPMRKFKARIGTEHDPLTLDGYARHWKEKRHLTSMPNEVGFDPIDDAHSTGEWVQRLIETVEIQAVLIEQLNQRVKDLEGTGDAVRMED